MVVLPMGATGPMQVGLQRLEAVSAVAAHLHAPVREGSRGTVPRDGHAGEGSRRDMAAVLVALLVRAVMTGVSVNNQVKISARGLHPDNLSLRAARPPRRQRVATGG
eukprot:CAMPEP_0119063696 /NCGR_PEP_ID=MMETSP1178-20130426/6969_1 /TAXON_ID=33656 /ORGANISM="unid sp, Strain CCMP2000" /LENGTH=106 /DNA_ID=CAMNT_0007045075 /DNA_START=91 /DNA_END=410 /DNA_ORIENTATION=-